jgi:hypothetical protein
MNASMRRRACLAVAAGALVAAPGPAQGQTPTSAAYTTSDSATEPSSTFRWTRTDGGGTDAVIAQGGTVTFTTPADSARPHNVDFTQVPASAPACVLTRGSGTPGLPMPTLAGARDWSGTCTFADPGGYRYVCRLHPAMAGMITVQAPPPVPQPGSGPPPPAPGGPTPPPAGSGPTPVTAAAAAQLRLARHQRGTRLRGSLAVRAAGARVEVVVRRRGRAGVRVARLVRTNAQPGRLAFALRLSPGARRALRARTALTLRVRIAVTAPGAEATTWVRTVRLRRA